LDAEVARSLKRLIEARAYNIAIRVCHAIVVSGKIAKQYMKTLQKKFGYRGEIILY
jgi:hypothetical protein